MAKAKTNCVINGKSYFRITKVVPVRTKAGTIERKKKPFYGSSESAAKKKYDQYLENFYKEEEQRKKEQEQQKDILEKITLQDRAEEYVENVLLVSQKYAKGTISQYCGAYKNYIKDSSLGMMPLKDICPMDLQMFYNSLDVSQQRLKAIHKFMSAFNKWLCLSNYSSDFVSAVELPKKDSNTRHDGIVTWTEEEVEQILSCMARQPRHKQYFLVHLLLYSGMRISEALALKYSDIHDGAIHIERQYYLGEEKAPKWNSKRIVPLHEKLIEPLRIHKEWHENEMQKNGYKTDYVFTTSNGNLFHQASVRKALLRFYNRNNIPYKHIHAYRATFCTQLCRCNVPVHVASKLLGHKNIDVTVAHYALVKEDTLEDAIRELSY